MGSLVFMVVCEAAADFRTASELAERVIGACVDYVEPDQAAYFWQWRGRTDQVRFWRWGEIDDEARAAGVRVRGLFDAEPGAPDARIARRALIYLRNRRQDGLQVDAILLIRDDDGDLNRRTGLEQARDAVPDLRDRVVVGLAHLKRESWVLNGFVPGDHEALLIAELRRELSFDPIIEAHRLTAKQDHELRSAKRVLRRLTQDQYDREAACWRQTALDTLRERGGATGLTAFLAEVEARLPPLLAGPHNRVISRG